jgi:DNA-binding transcriptional LysR family regulator
VLGVDLEAVRTFVAIADAGRFQDAAGELSITQQAVSKRVAALEKSLGARLFSRTARGAKLTVDGQAFLPHARDLLQAEQRARASVRPGRRALRVDVIGRRLGPADVLRAFHRAHPGVELDVLTLPDVDAAIEAIRSGTADAAFRAVTAPGRSLPDDISTLPAFDEPIQLLTGPGHALASRETVRPDELAGHRIWMPGLVAGTESAAYYLALAGEFGLRIEITAPDLGAEPLLDALAESPELATFVGDRTRLAWPAGHDLRRIALRDPEPVYAHSLLWHRDNAHPALAALREHLGSAAGLCEPGTWAPGWSRAGLVPVQARAASQGALVRK